MNENRTGRNGFVDVGIVVLAILLFFRTADVLSYFAPGYINNLIGADVSWLYAGIMAFFVEGLAVAYHFDKRTKFHTRAKVAMWTLIGISALCQVFDGNIITNNLTNMGGPLKTVFQYGVPLLPIFIFVLLAWVGGMPEVGDSRSWLDKLQDKGIKSRLPSMDAIINGRKNSEFSQSTPSQVVKANINRPVNDADIALAKSINPLAAPYRACPKCDDAVPLTEQFCAVCGTEMPALPQSNNGKATVNPTIRQP